MNLLLTIPVYSAWLSRGWQVWFAWGWQSGNSFAALIISPAPEKCTKRELGN